MDQIRLRLKIFSVEAESAKSVNLIILTKALLLTTSLQCETHNGNTSTGRRETNIIIRRKAYLDRCKPACT